MAASVFRDLANEIGIKSASVHHHFPTKATMAAAVARRYGDRFFTAVVRRRNETAEDAVAAYRSAFKAALDRDGLVCLFGVLGADPSGSKPRRLSASDRDTTVQPMSCAYLQDAGLSGLMFSGLRHIYASPQSRQLMVAVGTAVASRPPRRSRCAAFSHRAPVSGRT